MVVHSSGLSVQGVQNGAPHFEFTRFEGPPLLINALSKAYELLFMIVFLL